MSRDISKRDLSILIGNAIDHFDTSIYSFLAPTLARVFFPKYDPIVQLILAYSVLATSLVTRPFGAFIFGMLASLRGPVTCLSYSLIGVAIATVLIGLIPEYSRVGWFATIALIFLRMIKGVFAAGESTIAKLYIMEGKENEDAFKSSYLYQGSSMAGIILASLLSTIVFYYKDYEDLWRLCFLLGGSACFASYFLRLYSKHEIKTTSFNCYHTSSLKSLVQNWKVVLAIATTTGLSHITYYVPFVVMNSIVPLITEITLEEMMKINTFLLIFDMVAIYLFGRLFKRIDFRKIMIFSTATLAIFAPLVLSALSGASLLYVSLVRVFLVLLGVIFLCPLNVYYKNLSARSQNHQYFIVGMSSAIGTATIGRFTPMLCLWLWHVTGKTISIGLYISVISLLVVLFIILNNNSKVATIS